MSVEEKLKPLGWHFSQEWLTECLQNENSGGNVVERIIKTALDEDIRRFGASFISDEVVKEKNEWIFKNNCVFQVHKITNISAPKSNEESSTAPRLLHVQLSDGSQLLQALDLHQLPSLSVNIAPGTKIKIKTGRLPCLGGILILEKSSVEVLGGTVAALIEKWQINRSLAKYNRTNWASSGVGGPPPWVPFGQKIITSDAKDANGKFKSFGSVTKEKEDDDFEQQRKATIAEAAKSKLESGRRVFGGGRSTVPDTSVSFDNNYHVRDRNREARSEGPGREPRSERPDRGRGRGRRDRRGGASNDGADEMSVSAPSKPQTLFDFLESKMTDMTLKNRNHVRTEQSYNAGKSPTNRFNTSGVQSSNQASKFYSDRNDPLTVTELTQPNFNTRREVRHDIRNTQNSYHGPSTTSYKQEKESISYKTGDRCVAMYWEDNKYYPAIIHAVAPSGATCVVRFLQFGNYEEVFLEHVKPQQNRGNTNYGRGGRGGGRGGGRQFTPSNRSNFNS